MGKQAFVNTCYLQSFMKTNTCPRGKNKLDCITSLDIQYLKKEKKSKKKSTFVSSKMLFQTFSSFRKMESNPSHEFAGDRKNLLASVFRLHRTNLRANQSNDLFSAFCHSSFFGNFLCYSYFLLVGLLSVLFVCITFYCS